MKQLSVAKWKMESDISKNSGSGGLAKRDALLIFQGGGAKGIVHVGALTAIEQLNLNIRGVAGTSAGAIVAALVAVGFSGSDLVNVKDGTHLLRNKFEDFTCSKPTDLFGPLGWGLLTTLGFCIYWGPTLWVSALFAAIMCCIYDHDGWAFGLAIVCIVAPVLFAVWVAAGVCSVNHIRRFVGSVLRSKIKVPNGQEVTFADLDANGCLPLKIVATNVSEERAEVFSFERTPSVAVADAVAASICLPIIFRPHEFLCKRGNGVTANAQKRRYVDGGLISNLPVWTLDEERDEHERAKGGEILTLAFGIESKELADGMHKVGHWFPAIISAVVGGALELDMRKVANVHHFPMACSLKLMDFHKKQEDYFEAVSKSHILVQQLLKDSLLNFPKNIDDACKAIHQEVTNAVRAQIGVWHQSEHFTVRVALAMQHRGDYGPPTWQFQHGFSEFPDSDIGHHAVWELGTKEFDFFAGGEWQGEHWRLTIPVSGRKVRAQHAKPQVERALIILIECDAVPPPDLEGGSNIFPFIDQLDRSVVDFCYKTEVYTAVQKRTSLPWD
ncbi:patatin-like phospholipase family protein [Paraburkholderia sp. SIMBA_009]